MMRKLHYAGVPGDGFGWGVCNNNLIRELSKVAKVTCGELLRVELTDSAVLMPLVDTDFNPAYSGRGTKNLSYCFFEYPLGPNAKKNSRKYDVVFCGSEWCQLRMGEAGITNGKVLVQGVDHSIFYPK